MTWPRPAAMLAIAVCVAAPASTAIATSAGAAPRAAHVSLIPATGPPGSKIVVKGSGFAGAASVTVQFDGTARGSGTTSGTGSFSVTISVPRAAFGTHHVRAVDARGHSASASYQVTPTITVSPITVTPYDPLCNQIHRPVPDIVKVNAFGYPASAALLVKMGSRNVHRLTADSAGTASGSFTVPPQTAGNRTVTVSDNGLHLRRRVVFVESFTCWTASSNGSGLNWAWDGVGWDANVTVTMHLTLSNGTHRTMHRTITGPHGGFGIIRWHGVCPVPGTYPVTVTGRSQGRTTTIPAGQLHILSAC
ncbi:MAG: Ig-like domain-containing protein [Gaiellales bacterium]